MKPDFSKMMQMMSGGTGGQSFDEENFQWTDEGKKRVERVPAGFMRGMTIKRVESYAKENGYETITLEVAEKGLENSKSMMSSFMGVSDETPTDPNAVDLDEDDEFAPVAAPDYYVCGMCGYTIKGFAPDECPICLAAKEKFKKITDEMRKEFLTDTSGKVMRWEKEALERLEKIPEGFMRDMTKWRIEQVARKANILTITLKVVEDKYDYWKEGSEKVEVELTWDEEATERINRIPGFVKGMVQKEVERHAKAHNINIVTADILAEVRKKWEMGDDFHSNLEA
ncbi:MAG: hypothetical protein HQK84_07890 [Nitrospinae bacterium]|nr:hypothetical protein [Nitrospinota bacterium]